MDSASRLQATHRPAPARRALVSPPAPRLLHPGASPPSHLRQPFDFQIHLRPMWSCSPSSPAGPSRPMATRAAVHGISPPQFPHPLSLPAPARVLPSASPRTSASGRTSSAAANTSPSAPQKKPSLFAPVPKALLRWQMPNLPSLSVSPPPHSDPSPTPSPSFPFPISSLASPDQTPA